MTLFAEVLRTAKDALAVRDTAMQQLNEANAALLAANVCLSALCKPVCLIAVQKYNARARQYSIDIATMETAVELTKDSLRLLVALRDRRGQQPDEDLEDSDEDAINKVLKPLIDAALKKEKVALTFGGVLIPTSYFSK